MSMKRGRPEAARGETVGPHTGENFANPWNMGIDREYEEGNDRKTLRSPSANTVGGLGAALHDNYDELWEGR